MEENITTEEILLCAADPIRFLRQFATIEHPSRAATPFIPHYYQESIIYSYYNHGQVLTLSARQTGISVTNALYAFWFAMFRANKTILLFSSRADESAELLYKIRFAYKNAPEWVRLLCGIKTNNKHEMVFTNGTKIISLSSLADAARGYTPDLVIMDSFTHMTNRIQDELLQSLAPMVRGCGCSLIISTTAGGDVQIFKSLWDEAKSGKNNFITNWVRWDSVPDRGFDFRASTENVIGEERWNVEYECSDYV